MPPSALALPLRLWRRVLRLTVTASRGGVPPELFFVGVLNAQKASAVLYSVRQAAETVKDQEVVRVWLNALFLCQAAQERLLADLRRVDDTLQFWLRRLEDGRHGRFLLLSQGPLAFAQEARALLLSRSAELDTASLSAAEQVEQRVVVLRMLRGALLRALATVSAAALRLDLRPPEERQHPQQGQQGQGGDETPNGPAGGGSARGSVAGEEAGGSGTPKAGEGAGEEAAALKVWAGKSAVWQRRVEAQAQAAAQETLGQALAAAEGASRAITEVVQQVRQVSRQYADVEARGGPQGEEGRRETAGKAAAKRAVLLAQAMHGMMRKGVSTADWLRKGPGARGKGEAPGGEAPPGEAPPGPRLSAGAAGSAAERAQHAVEEAAGELGLRLPHGTASSANSALSAAAAAVARHPGKVVKVPGWAAMPTRLQQRWIRYSLYGLGSAYALYFLYRHSALAGSGDLGRWARGAHRAARNALLDNVVAPLTQLRDELFRTFRQRRSIVTVEEFETDKASLQRMLADFRQDYLRRHAGKGPDGQPHVVAAPPAATGQPAPASGRVAGPVSGEAAGAVAGGAASGAAAGVAGETAGESVASGATRGAGAAPAALGPAEAGDDGAMDFMMRSYEGELKHPLRNLVNGELMRSVLIQVQKVKVDSEAAMLEIDQILKANELSISLVAAVPSILIAGGLLYGLARWLIPSAPDPYGEALPARMALVEVERALAELARAETLEAEGEVVWRVAVVFQATAALYRRHSGLRFLRDTGSEWPNLRADLLELGAPGGDPRAKLGVCARATRSYSLFRS